MVTPLMIIKTHVHAKSDDTMKNIHKSHKMDIATHFKQISTTTQHSCTKF